MNKKYRVTPTAAERQELGGVLARGKAAVRRLIPTCADQNP
jgi:hypothetical protein